MRVLAVTPWFPNAVSPGSGIFNLRDVELLAVDHEVQVLHLIAPRLMDPAEPETETIAPGITVHRVPYDLRNPGLLLRARSRVRELLTSADLVHTMAFPALFPTKLARPRVPWVHTEHWTGLVKPAPTLRARAGAFFLRRDLDRPDELVAVSQYFADVIDRYRSHPTRVIANHVRITDTEVAAEPPQSSQMPRARLVGVAGLVPWKGPLETLDAVSQLLDRGYDATLDWAGVGTLEHRMRSIIDERGLTDRVRLHGHVPPEELSRLLLESDVFVLPTEVETFGVAIAEALGHGLPVVTSGYGGHLEFLPPEASRLVTDRSGSALADAIDDVLSDESTWAAEQIIEYAREAFGNDARQSAYAKVYAEAVKQYSARK